LKIKQLTCTPNDYRGTSNTGQVNNLLTGKCHIIIVSPGHTAGITRTFVICINVSALSDDAPGYKSLTSHRKVRPGQPILHCSIDMLLVRSTKTRDLFFGLKDYSAKCFWRTFISACVVTMSYAVMITLHEIYIVCYQYYNYRY